MTIHVDTKGTGIRITTASMPTLDDLIGAYVRYLDQVASSRREAAAVLGIVNSTYYKWVEKLGLPLVRHRNGGPKPDSGSDERV